MGCDLSPPSMVKYFNGYLRGRADPRKDLRNGHVALEVYALGAGDLVKPPKERYGVEVRVVAGCVVDERLMGHARGYYLVSYAEIARRFGDQILDRETGEPRLDFMRNTQPFNQ
jgi:hypothetical protein